MHQLQGGLVAVYEGLSVHQHGGISRFLKNKLELLVALLKRLVPSPLSEELLQVGYPPAGLCEFGGELASTLSLSFIPFTVRELPETSPTEELPLPGSSRAPHAPVS